MAITSIIIPLSGSSGNSGAPIPLNSTAIGDAQTLHTAHATQWDQPIIQAANASTLTQTLVLGFGSTLAPELSYHSIPPQDGYMAILNGDAVLSSGKVVKAYTLPATNSTTALNVIGKVIRTSTA